MRAAEAQTQAIPGLRPRFHRMQVEKNEMTLRQNSNLNIESITPFEPPNAFLRRLPATPAISETVNRSREEIGAILNGRTTAC